MPRYSGWSFEMTSPRRHAAMIGTWSSSANRISSVDVRARRTPPPARIDRSPGRGEQLDDRADLVRRRPGGRGSRRVGRLELDDLVEEVLRQRQQHRTGPAGQRLADGLGHDRRDVLGAARLGRPLGQPAERRDLVDLLERLAAEEVALDLADEREHRARVLPRRVDPDGEIGGADRARREARGRPTGQLPVGLGHERGAALVPRRDDPDPGVAERVEQAEERLARNGERVAHAGGPQGVGDEPPDGPRAGPRLDLRRGRLGLGLGVIVPSASIGLDPASGRRAAHRRAAHRRRASAAVGVGDRVGRQRSRAVRPVAAVRRGVGHRRQGLGLGLVGGGLGRGLGRRSGVELGHGDGVSSSRSAAVPAHQTSGWATAETTRVITTIDGDDDHHGLRGTIPCASRPTGSSGTGAARARPVRAGG